jgi:hypothetical protein
MKLRLKTSLSESQRGGAAEKLISLASFPAENYSTARNLTLKTFMKISRTKVSVNTHLGGLYVLACTVNQLNVIA